MAVLGLIRTAPEGQHAGIADVAFGWLERMAVEMLNHIERHHGLEHRNFHELPLARPLTREQGRQHRIGRHLSAGFIRHDGGHIAGLAG